MEKESTDKGEKEEMKVVRTADHRSHYAIGVVPQWSEDDLRLHLYNEVIEGQGGPYHISTAQLIIPKGALPRLIEVLEAVSRSEGKAMVPKVASIPKELAFMSKKPLKELGTAGKRKVMKIRKA
ncbi:MAG: hypothetical protein MUC62_01715 [Candidatus Thermoplasmatota archaeon]|jgi:hypothetical protein|nr:hypothetical protein [Candidatus Thermoplasmatota archaeon]